MEKRVKKSRKILEEDQPYIRRATRSKTRQMPAELRSRDKSGLRVKNVPGKPPDGPEAELPNPVGYNAVDRTEAPDLRSQRMHRSLEENLLAFLDGSATAEPEEMLEDKMMFLEATHSMCVVPRLAHVPTAKMCQAILEFIQDCMCVELTMSSFELLNDLGKRHPRVAIGEVTSPEPGRKRMEVIVDEKVWSPLEDTCKELAVPRQLVTNSTTEVSSNIFVLLEAIARRLRESEKPTTKKADGERSKRVGNYVVVLSQFMMLQYLMSLIQADLHCRLEAFYIAEDKDFTLMQESYLYRLLFSLNHPEKKGLMMNLDSIMEPIKLYSEDGALDENGCGESADLPAKPAQEKQEGLRTALQATARDFGRLGSSLLVMIMKLESLNQEFGVPSSLPRGGNRLLFDALLSICTEASTLHAYLNAISDPSAKLKFVVDYFVNFAPKQVQGLGDCALRESMERLLSCFTDRKTLKSLIKVFKEAFALPLLLSHAFQAFLLLQRVDDDHSNQEMKNSAQESRISVCKLMIIALNNLKPKEPLPILEETLFVATRISVC